MRCLRGHCTTSLTSWVRGTCVRLAPRAAGGTCSRAMLRQTRRAACPYVVVSYFFWLENSASYVLFRLPVEQSLCALSAEADRLPEGAHLTALFASTNRAPSMTTVLDILCMQQSAASAVVRSATAAGAHRCDQRQCLTVSSCVGVACVLRAALGCAGGRAGSRRDVADALRAQAAHAGRVRRARAPGEPVWAQGGRAMPGPGARPQPAGHGCVAWAGFQVGSQMHEATNLLVTGAQRPAPVALAGAGVGVPGVVMLWLQPSEPASLARLVLSHALSSHGRVTVLQPACGRLVIAICWLSLSDTSLVVLWTPLRHRLWQPVLQAGMPASPSLSPPICRCCLVQHCLPSDMQRKQTVRL